MYGSADPLAVKRAEEVSRVAIAEKNLVAGDPRQARHDISEKARCTIAPAPEPDGVKIRPCRHVGQSIRTYTIATGKMAVACEAGRMIFHGKAPGIIRLAQHV